MTSLEQERAQLAGELEEQTRRNERLTDQLAAATDRADHAETAAERERDARQTAEHISQTAQSRADRLRDERDTAQQDARCRSGSGTTANGNSST